MLPVAPSCALGSWRPSPSAPISLLSTHVRRRAYAATRTDPGPLRPESVDSGTPSRGAVMPPVLSRRHAVGRPSRPLAVLVAAMVLVGASSVSAAAHPERPAGGGATVVLVHGAFADASSWNGVVELLQYEGHTVIAPGLPMRGLASDRS